jgi:hypothetical protein
LPLELLLRLEALLHGQHELPQLLDGLRQEVEQRGEPERPLLLEDLPLPATFVTSVAAPILTSKLVWAYIPRKCRPLCSNRPRLENEGTPPIGVGDGSKRDRRVEELEDVKTTENA